MIHDYIMRWVSVPAGVLSHTPSVKYKRAEAVIRGGGRATNHSAAGRRRRGSASTATGPSRPTEAARGRPQPRLSAAVISETLRIVRVEIRVTLSKSITW